MASINYSNARKYRHWGQEEEEEPVGSETEARKQIVKELVHKQLSKRLSIEQQLENKSKFIKSTSQETVIGSTGGLASYEKFRDLESMVNAKEVLKSLGLSDSDVGLLCEEKEDGRVSSLEAPDARRQRLEAIERKLAGRTKHHDRSELNSQSEGEKEHQITQTNKQRDSEDSTKYPKQKDLSCQKEERSNLTSRQSYLNQLREAPKQNQGDSNPQEEEEEDRDLNPYQIYLKNQLREIAHKLFPQDQNEGGTCTGKGESSVCFQTEELRDIKDNTSVYLTEETIKEESFPTNNINKRCIRKRKSVGSFESSELKKDKKDSSCVYLTEKPKSYWDMDKVPKIIQKRSDYPRGPYPSRPRGQGCEMMIHVAKTTNRKGEECKTVKVTKNMKIDQINEIVNDTKDEKMNADENNVNKTTQTDKNTNKVDLANKTIIDDTKEYKKMNAGENNMDKMTQLDKNTNVEIDRRNKIINEARNDDTNEDKRNADENNIDKTTETNKNNTNVNPIDTTRKTVEDDTNEGNSKDAKQNVSKTTESNAELNKTITNDTKNKDTREDGNKNTKMNQNKTTGIHKNNTGINTTSRTVIQITKHDSKPDTTKPFILTLPESELTPLSTIKSNRVSIKDLKKIDKFKNYEEGTPSQTLYLKNLSSSVSPSDLASIMGHFETLSGPKITYRVLGGRMKGQAFVTFSDVQTATEALKVCNGYLFYGKPLVAAYGRKV